MKNFRKLSLLAKYISSFKETKKLLKSWWQHTLLIPQPLQEQAQASLRDKAFHCLGGSIYALYPGVNQRVVLQAIVALQTISDYLDNLCDRMEVNSQQAFSQLHLSFSEALDPEISISNYYQYYPYHEEHYLPALVKACRQAICQLPNYQKHKPLVLELANHYCQLQVLKHLQPNGETKLKQWINNNFTDSELTWNEWAAATGSTLGIFMLLAASYHNYDLKLIKGIFACYFPWIQALHIQLDYLIDANEDIQHNDLNFTFYYQNTAEAISRLQFLYQESKNRIGMLPYSHFHELIIEGLICLYGSDPKVKSSFLYNDYRTLLHDRSTHLMYQACRALRKAKVLI